MATSKILSIAKLKFVILSSEKNLLFAAGTLLGS
jgi:hypothetical protein